MRSAPILPSEAGTWRARAWHPRGRRAHLQVPNLRRGREHQAGTQGSSRSSSANSREPASVNGVLFVRSNATEHSLLGPLSGRSAPRDPSSPALGSFGEGTASARHMPRSPGQCCSALCQFRTSGAVNQMSAPCTFFADCEATRDRGARRERPVQQGHSSSPGRQRGNG
jgi:hypothetical protein